MHACISLHFTCMTSGCGCNSYKGKKELRSTFLPSHHHCCNIIITSKTNEQTNNKRLSSSSSFLSSLLRPPQSKNKKERNEFPFVFEYIKFILPITRCLSTHRMHMHTPREAGTHPSIWLRITRTTYTTHSASKKKQQQTKTKQKRFFVNSLLFSNKKKTLLKSRSRQQFGRP